MVYRSACAIGIVFDLADKGCACYPLAACSVLLTHSNMSFVSGSGRMVGCGGEEGGIL